MASIKPCCCISNRIATLLCLCFFLITFLWFELPNAIVYWNWNSPSFFSNSFLLLFYLFIYSATIISIIIKKPRLSLLYLVPVISIKGVIQVFFSILTIFSYSNGFDLVLLLANQVVSIYSIWVFYCYILELNEKRADGGVVLNRVDDREANFSNTSAGYPR